MLLITLFMAFVTGVMAQEGRWGTAVLGVIASLVLAATYVWMVTDPTPLSKKVWRRQR